MPPSNLFGGGCFIAAKQHRVYLPGFDKSRIIAFAMRTPRRTAHNIISPRHNSFILLTLFCHAPYAWLNCIFSIFKRKIRCLYLHLWLLLITTPMLFFIFFDPRFGASDQNVIWSGVLVIPRLPDVKASLLRLPAAPKGCRFFCFGNGHKCVMPLELLKHCRKVSTHPHKFYLFSMT